jgi:hypothetical protein
MFFGVEATAGSILFFIQSLCAIVLSTGSFLLLFFYIAAKLIHTDLNQTQKFLTWIILIAGIIYFLLFLLAFTLSGTAFLAALHNSFYHRPMDTIVYIFLFLTGLIAPLLLLLSSFRNNTHTRAVIALLIISGYFMDILWQAILFTAG